MDHIKFIPFVKKNGYMFASPFADRSMSTCHHKVNGGTLSNVGAL